MVSEVFAAGAKTSPARPELLDHAFNAFVADRGRWAYTETHYAIVDNKPSLERESIFKVDPSRPYVEQFVPIKLGGKPPSEKDLKQWAERGEREAKLQQKQAAEEKAEAYGNEEVSLYILNQQVTPLLEHATVITEDETAVTYDIPMRKAGKGVTTRFEAFQLSVRVGKQRQEFQYVTIRQLKEIRIAAGTYTDGLIEIEFSSPVPRFPAVPVKVSSQTTNKPMFGKAVRGHTVSTRTDLKHVTPYDERFGVKVGPLRTITF